MATSSALAKSTFVVSVDRAIAIPTPGIPTTSEKRSWVEAPLSRSTERNAMASLDFSVVEPKVDQVAPERIAVAPRRDFVNGTILGDIGDSVECELDLPEGQYSIRLPGALFPADSRHGMPFRLRLVEVAGIRQPIVELREPESTNSRQTALQQLDHLVALLEEP